MDKELLFNKLIHKLKKKIQMIIEEIKLNIMDILYFIIHK